MKTIALNAWEQVLVGASISLLTLLESKLTNTVEVAALKSAISFLQTLLDGNVAGER